MPKTKAKDAFALRDFDTTRIFEELNFSFTQRQHLPFLDCTSDEAYLTDLLDLHTQRFSTHGEIVSILISYQEKIVRHIDRLARYSAVLVFNAADGSDFQVTRNKLCRAKELSDRYREIANAVGRLQSAVERVAQEMNSRIRKNFATRLKGWRNHLGLTQAQLATKINMSQGGYTQYELARRDPSIPTLVRLAEIFDCTTDELLGLTNERD